MREVTNEELWDFVKDKDVAYHATGYWPYAGIWRTRDGSIIGKQVPVGRHLGTAKDKFRCFILDDLAK